MDNLRPGVSHTIEILSKSLELKDNEKIVIMKCVVKKITWAQFCSDKYEK